MAISIDQALRVFKSQVESKLSEALKLADVDSTVVIDDDDRLGTRYLAQRPDDGEGGFIADGALSYWKYFEEYPQLKNAFHISDFWHATEHLQKAADALFTDEEQHSRWVKEYKQKLELSVGGADSLIAST